MAARPHEHEGTSLELDHLHTDDVRHRRVTRAARHCPRLATRGSRHIRRRRTRSRRSASSASRSRVLLAGGAMLSSASGSPSAVVRPAANTVRAVGGAPSFGPATGMRLNADLVGIAATPSGRGYWAVAADGGVFAFGDAPLRGLGRRPPARAPIVGIAATPTGHGYWLVGCRRRRLRLR